MSENLPAVPGKGLPAVPDFMKVEGDTSTDAVQQYIRPSRIKVVQSLSDDEVKKTFGVGSVILSPANILIRKVKRDSNGEPMLGATEPIRFTPIFMFTEFCTWNPIAAKGSRPPVIARSFDPKSDIAQKARDFKSRTERHPENSDWEVTHCEHINFIIRLLDFSDEFDEACLLTFSRGEFKAGTDFASLIKMRRGVPLYGSVYELNLVQRKNAKGSWLGLDVSNPVENPYVNEAQFAQFKEEYEFFKEKHAAAQIQPDYEPYDEGETIDATSKAAESI
jgi:hypothetical protein